MATTNKLAQEYILIFGYSSLNKSANTQEVYKKTTQNKVPIETLETLILQRV